MKPAGEKITSIWNSVVRDPLETQQVFVDNEIRANYLFSKAMLGGAGVLLLCFVLNVVHVLEISSRYVMPVFLVGIPALVIPALISLALHGERNWIKHMLLISFTVTLAYINAILTFNVPLLMAMPVVFSCRYYSCSFTVKTTVLTTVLFAVSAWAGAVLHFDNRPDLNFAADNLHTYVRDIMVLSFMPRWLIFTIISAVCYEIARYGRKLVIRQNEISQNAARVSTELEMAGRIQNEALPTVDSLPQKRFPRFDLAAEMIPAKEVGGDFYDFFYPDSSHLALIIADVADKGIAASLYMMMSKTLLGSSLSTTLSPGSVLERVNRQLYEESPKGMFVTAWLGVLDLNTGVLTSANAGHEYPALRRAGGSFEIIKDRHGFVLAGRKTSKYPEHTVTLNKGDTLFVYTDGITEARSQDGQMFGRERMLESLNRCGDCQMNSLISGIKADIDAFASGASQSDDITMIAFTLSEPAGKTGIEVKPDISELYIVQDYIAEAIEKERIPSLQIKKIKVAVDEMFTNIVQYSGATLAQVLCEKDGSALKITFVDDGTAFNPLEDGAGASSEHGLGQGIFITRQFMDDMQYSREDGRNVLTLVSNI